MAKYSKERFDRRGSSKFKKKRRESRQIGRGDSEGSGRDESGGSGRGNSDGFRGRKSPRFEQGDTGGFGRRGPGKNPNNAGRPELHNAVCVKCGKRCEVPFKPSPGKPVYCSDCFRRVEGSSKPVSAADQLDTINRKLDKILHALHLD
jgi:CxxC-x17-CxxC domain-containing protein